MKKTTLQKKTIDELVLIDHHGGRKPSIALIYPNDYTSSVSNLGFNAVYTFLSKKGFDCERFVYSKDARSIESGRRLGDFDIWAFSISFEFDALNVLNIFRFGGVPSLSKERGGKPLVIVGGALTFFNPNVFWSVADIIFHGELEGCESFFEKLEDLWQSGLRGKQLLEKLSIFKCLSFPELGEKNVNVTRLKELDLSLAESSILSPKGAFGRRYLLEVERGCTRGCRFCVAGYVYRPARFMSLAEVEKRLEKALTYTKKVGLVAATVSDYPFLDALLDWMKGKVESLSVSSLRLDALTPHLIETLKKLGDREITLAPEAGTQRMRDVIYKNISEEDIARAIRYVKDSGLKRVKLYFMYGLPTEKEEDLNGIIEMVKEVKRNRIIPYISLNPFIPKPWTPFEEFQMMESNELKKRKRYLESGFRNLGVRFKFESVRLSRYQWVVSTATKELSYELAKSEEPAEILKEVEKTWGSNAEEWKYVNAVNDGFFALQKKSFLNLNDRIDRSR